MPKSMPHTYNIHEAKSQLSKLLEQVAQGDEVIIARAGTPVARLVPMSASGLGRVLGTEVGQLVVSADFDAPMSPDDLAAFEG